MDMEWFTTSLTWYLYLFALGILFFPLATRIFGSFVDKGYPFAKTLGIIFASYTIYILGILHIVPFTREALFFLLVFIGFIFYRFFGKEIQSLKKLTPQQYVLLIGEELLFLIAFLFLVYVRGQEPSIRGLEKFMDFGFMQSINRTAYFPPLDMWYSADPNMPNGYPINYYYFGHLTGTFLTKLSGISPFIGYNLVLATIFGQGITLAFSLTSNIVYLTQRYIIKKYLNPLFIIFFGLVGSFLVNLAGNLHTIYIFTKGYPNENPVPFWQIFQSSEQIHQTMASYNKTFLEAMIQNSSYWYPNATRFIPFTIHEFPSYSYVVADLHGHVFDIPFVLVTIALLFVFLFRLSVTSNSPKNTFITWFKKRLPIISKQKWFPKKLSSYEVWFAVLLGFFIAIHYMTNAFDGPIYVLMAMLIFFVIYRLSTAFFLMTGLLGGSFILFSLPFSAFFAPFVSGIGVNCSPSFLVNIQKLGPFMFEKGNCQVSEPWMLFILWGFFWTSFLLYGIFVFLITREKPNKKNLFTSIDYWLLISFGFGTFLILIPEFFYIKDIYPAHFRANTMFKMGYQAYIIMSIASAVVLYRISLWHSWKKYILKGIYAVLFLLVFMYPFLAFPSYYAMRPINQQPPQLDGSVWMNAQYPQDKEIIEYIEQTIPHQPVIMEAQGDSYTDYNRISAYTGVPTVAGWWVHEWLWRGTPEIVGNRIPEIVAFYESENIAETKQIIQKYHIKYAVVSNLEREKYPNLNEEKFEQIGTKIFESSNGFGALYRIK
ncbi:MAG TPA: DUF2298 domain-containing protein [Candidatus Woesebacteria bacterium]|nr:DUF2298 domain-containing protein [Candidatus Woesebacteria bacterium]